MKIEKLTDNKIRIIVNIDELSKKIDIKDLIKNDDESFLLFQNLLKEAEKQVGFTVQGCRLLVEAFSTSEGFIVFTLTKHKIESSSQNKKLKIKRKSLNNCYSNAIYKFNTFEDFCNFCTYCKKSPLSKMKNFAKNISLYEYNNLYYLIFFNINENYKHTKLFYTTIAEFSNLASTSLVFKSNIVEHGNVIFKTSAIENCIKHFS